MTAEPEFTHCVEPLFLVPHFPLQSVGPHFCSFCFCIRAVDVLVQVLLSRVVPVSVHLQEGETLTTVHVPSHSPVFELQVLP